MFQMIMEIPLELMLTISQKLPWMFFPDIVPVGHPIFDIINSTNPEVCQSYIDILWRGSMLIQFTRGVCSSVIFIGELYS